MSISIDIQRALDWDIQQIKSPPGSGPAAPAAPVARCSLPIERLAIHGEDPRVLRKRLEAAMAEHSVTGGADAAIVAQAVMAEIEIERLQRLRATVRTEQQRQARVRFERACEDEVARLRRSFNESPARAVRALRRSYGGVTFLMERWENLARMFERDQTLYGAERIEAVQLQGLSALVDDLYLDEQAWQTWMDCLAAQPNPKERDIDLICARDVVPKSIQDRDLMLWPQDPDACRARLRATIEAHLEDLRALEPGLRAEHEAAIAALPEKALLEIQETDQKLLQALRGHERSLLAAHRALKPRRPARRHGGTM
jgi:hypothetical protein